MVTATAEKVVRKKRKHRAPASPETQLLKELKQVNQNLKEIKVLLENIWQGRTPW